MAAVRGDDRLPLTGCIILPIALFIALMIATAGTAIYPRASHIGAALLCSGEVAYESHGASYRPGEYTVTREIYCRSGAGKDAQEEEITFQAVGVSFLIYAVFFFLLIRFAIYPWMRRRGERALQAVVGARPASSGAPPFSPNTTGPAAGLDLQAILAQVSEAVERGQAHIVVNDATVVEMGEGGDVAERLAQLKALRDQGLISAADYEAKKAEILSRL